MFLLSSADLFSNLIFSKKSFRNTISVYKSVFYHMMWLVNYIFGNIMYDTNIIAFICQNLHCEKAIKCLANLCILFLSIILYNEFNKTSACMFDPLCIFQINNEFHPKTLEPSCKTDLEFWEGTFACQSYNRVPTCLKSTRIYKTVLKSP